MSRREPSTFPPHAEPAAGPTATPVSGGAAGDSADVTGLLIAWSAGDSAALDALLPIVYAELRRQARRALRREAAGHTLQPTALVHEAFLRLRGIREMQLKNRAHFYGAAAQVMRRVLVDHARRRNAQKRNDGVSAGEITAALETPIDIRLDLLALSDALDALEKIAPDKAKIVELRYFGGLSVEETATFLGIAPATVKRHFAFARTSTTDGGHAVARPRHRPSPGGLARGRVGLPQHHGLAGLRRRRRHRPAPHVGAGQLSEPVPRSARQAKYSSLRTRCLLGSVGPAGCLHAITQESFRT